MLRRRRRNRFKFTEKKHSKKGIITLLCASVLLIIYLVFLKLAFNSKGTLSQYYGSAGVFAMLCSVVVFVFAVQSTKEEDSFPLFPRVSFGVSLFTLVCWMGTYIYGFMS